MNGTDDQAVLTVDDLRVWYPTKRRKEYVRAVDGVSFSIARGETLGLIGESGSGKSTLGRALLQLVPVSGGSALIGGSDLARLRRGKKRQAQARVQMIFQDPNASLDPRMRILASVEEPMVVQGSGGRAQRRQRALEMLDLVGLTPEHGNRYPHEMSGGQKQRVSIARALVLHPELVVCDEAVSALDVALQAEILELLQRLQTELGLAYLFITHDLGVVSHVSDRVAVMYLGVLMELAPVDSLVERPLHPYSEALVSSQPKVDARDRRERIVLAGDVPSPINPPSGCRFRTRCRYAQRRCEEEVPAWRELVTSHWVACHFAEELSLQGVRGAPHDGSTALSVLEH